MRATALDHLVLTVATVEAAADWYVRVLGMTRQERDGRVSVQFGHHKINLRPRSATQEEWFTGTKPCVGSGDLCFLVDADPEAVVAHLSRQGIAIERGPVTRDGAEGPIESVYCRDPDGNLIELSSYR